MYLIPDLGPLKRSRSDVKIAAVGSTELRPHSNVNRQKSDTPIWVIWMDGMVWYGLLSDLFLALRNGLRCEGPLASKHKARVSGRPKGLT